MLGESERYFSAEADNASPRPDREREDSPELSASPLTAKHHTNTRTGSPPQDSLPHLDHDHEPAATCAVEKVPSPSSNPDHAKCPVEGCNFTVLCESRGVFEDPDGKKMFYAGTKQRIRDGDCLMGQHIISEHILTDKGSNASNNDVAWACPYPTCDYTGRDQKRLEEHLVSPRHHDNIKHFFCQPCFDDAGQKRAHCSTKSMRNHFTDIHNKPRESKPAVEVIDVDAEEVSTTAVTTPCVSSKRPAEDGAEGSVTKKFAVSDTATSTPVPTTRSVAAINQGSEFSTSSPSPVIDQPAEDFNSLEAEFLRINARFQQALKAKIQQCRENVNDKKQRLANLEGECESIRLLIVDLKRQQMESEEKMEAIKVTVLEAKEAVEIAERELKETVNKQKH